MALVHENRLRLLTEKTLYYQEKMHWSKNPDMRSLVVDKLKSRICSEETKELLRARVVTPETREKLRLAGLGKKQTPEQQEKKRVAMLGKPGPNKGRKFSSEVRQKMSLAAKGRVFSDEHRRNLSKASKGHPPYGRPEKSKMFYYTAKDGCIYHLASSYENEVARYLDSINELWKYTGRATSHSMKLSNGCRYYPDFYLANYDIHIDPKGWDRDPRKREMVESEYPGQVVFLIGKTYLTQLKELLCQN